MYVIHTHCYGERPHDNYAVTMADGNMAVFEEPTYEAMLEAMGKNGYILPDIIGYVMNQLPMYTPTTSGYTEEVWKKGLEFAKEMATRAINAYDSSSAVNSFLLNGKRVWLDKATRVGLMNSTTIAKAMGSKTTDLWLGETKITVDCDKAIQLLSTLEMYALECFNVTAAHKKAVSEMTSLEEVIGYDFTKGYPDKLKMEV